jgi:hypothetical protein
MRTGKIAPIRPILSSEILFWTRKSMPRELEAREDLFREVREIPRPNLQRSMKKKSYGEQDGSYQNNDHSFAQGLVCAEYTQLRNFHERRET